MRGPDAWRRPHIGEGYEFLPFALWNVPEMRVHPWLSRVRSLPPRSRDLLLTCAYGLVAGLVAVLFQLGTNRIYDLAFTQLSRQPFATFAIASFGVVMASSLGVGILLSVFCPEAAGSGIPQLKTAFWKDFGMVPWRVAWVKFAAGILSLGGGASLGREGPSVQIAGATASCLAGVLGEPKHNRRPAAAAGAAAGLAAAFNTPLAAVTFVLEELIGDLNSRFLGSVLLAAFIGALVVHGLVGPQPAFQLAPVLGASWRVYLLIPVIAVATSLIGAWFQIGSLNLRLHVRQRRWSRIPVWCQPAVGGLVTWGLGMIVFRTTGKLGVFSLGYGDLSQALGAGLSWKLAGVLLIAKFVATVTCYGSGGCGGIFSPTLFLGGMAGFFLAGVADHVIPISEAEHITLAVVGMSCCLGSVVRAPVTGILIVFEMTHEFALVPALMLGAIISQAISRKLCALSFYDTILRQDGHEIERLVPPRNLRSWQHLPVSTITNFRPVVVESLDSDLLVETLKSHPFRWFPVVNDSGIVGLLSRDEMNQAALHQRPPNIAPALQVVSNETIREAQLRLLESGSGLILVTDVPGGRLLGLVTLHDLLRAELAAGEHSAE